MMRGLVLFLTLALFSLAYSFPNYSEATYDENANIDPNYVDPSGADQEEAKKCEKEKVDIIFVVDSSGSIKLANYQKELNFVSQMINSLQVGTDNVKVGAVIFSGVVQKLFDLKTHTTKEAASAAIKKAKYLSSSTATGKALNFILDDGMFETKSGGRPDVTNVVVVLTDGQSNKPALTKIAAERLKSTGTVVLTVGFGGAQLAELRTIASKKEYVFLAKDINQLLAAEKTVAALICQASNEEPVECEA